MSRPRSHLLALLALLSASGCWQSDQEAFHRHWEADRQRRIAGMRLATAQRPQGTPVEGDALVALLADTTHESVFDRTPNGDRRRYVERSYFAPDGRFVYMNSAWALDPEGREGDSWRVDGPRLCILNRTFSQTPQCYTITTSAEGRVQYFVDEPGDETHGLLTKIPTTVHRGRLPPPR